MESNNNAAAAGAPLGGAGPGRIAGVDPNDLQVESDVDQINRNILSINRTERDAEGMERIEYKFPADK